MADHEHDHDHALSGGKFLFVTVLNALITLVEFLGGIFAGSLSLISDGFHNLGDSLSVVLSYYAHRISGRPQTSKNTYGFKRAQIISAFVNSVFLIVVSGFLIIEAVQKLMQPEKVDGSLMFIVAIISTIANFISAVLLSRGSKGNLNVRATYLHFLSDSLSSVGIIIAGILINVFGWYFTDPLVTIIVAVYIMFETWPIIKKTIYILMQGAPSVDCQSLKKDILSVDGVTNVHHVHIWSIDENSIIFSAHVNMHDMLISDAEKIYQPISDLLKRKYNIDHVTIQAEVERGKEEDFFFDQGTDIK
ncbi:cation diffusion facilitator family transporter [Nicoliella spurrieriana]|uniref:Cation diffusion facilitator family transporter n=1 Tax=Nicoliella spurrieriana TaxID=2925830 RepID=A0A976X570_9LACO|nr:cation diffusion facilitator family transporter [Nicoliella spurrieriana]UQS86326.1 cation diffusion facilitator family transporter [Nicoliella spurrieriana]